MEVDVEPGKRRLFASQKSDMTGPSGNGDTMGCKPLGTFQNADDSLPSRRHLLLPRLPHLVQSHRSGPGRSKIDLEKKAAQ